MPASFLTIRGLSKRFGFQSVYKKFNLEIGCNEFVILCGPNGAGKSTLLRLISGLEKPDSGEILFDVAKHPKVSARNHPTIGFLSHSSGLYQDLTPWENLLFFASIYRINDGHQRALELLEDFHLADRKDHPVRTLSSGMVRRLAVALAMLNDPDLLLLDEPFAGLDYESQIDLLDQLRAVHARGCTIVCSTHEFSMDVEFLFRFIFLRKGQVVKDTAFHTLGEARDAYQELMIRPDISGKPENVDAVKCNKEGRRTTETDNSHSEKKESEATFRDYFSQVLSIVRKDLRTEFRTKEILNFMLLFALISLVIFSFALGLMGNQVNELVPGVIWATLSFSGLLGLSKNINREFAHGSMDVLRLAPIEPSAIYLGKLAGIFLIEIVISILVLTASLLFFNVNLFTPGTILALLFGTFGFSAAGTLLSTLVERTKSREMLLSVLLLPLLIPLLIASIRITQDAANGLPPVESLSWLRIVVIYDLFMCAAGMLTYNFSIED